MTDAARLARLTHALAGVLVLVVLTLIRVTPDGAHLEHRAEYGLGGGRAAWDALAAVLPAAVPLAVVVLGGCLIVLLGGARSWRGRAAWGVLVLVFANVGCVAVKAVVGAIVPAPDATLPSGHAALALSSAVVLAAVPQGRFRRVGAVLAGFVAVFGTLGVVMAYWHRPGDALAAAALVPVCIWAASGIVGRGGSASVARDPHGASPWGEATPARFHGGACAPEIVGGAAVALFTLLGWGFRPQLFWPDFLLGALDIVVLVGAAVVVVILGVRAVEETAPPTH